MALLTTTDLKRMLTSQSVTVPRFAQGLPIGHRMLDLHDDFVQGLKCLGISVDESQSSWAAPLMIVRLDPKNDFQLAEVAKYQKAGGLVGCLADDEYYWHNPAGAGIAQWDFKIVLCDEAKSIGPDLPSLSVPVWAAPLPENSWRPAVKQDLVRRCLYAGKPKADRLEAVDCFSPAVSWLEVPKPEYKQAMCASATTLFLNSKSHYGSITPRLKECLSSSVTLLPVGFYKLAQEKYSYTAARKFISLLSALHVASSEEILAKTALVYSDEKLRQSLLKTQGDWLDWLLDMERWRWFA